MTGVPNPEAAAVERRQRSGKCDGIRLPSLSAGDFGRLAEFVNARTGIRITEEKKTLFESRLQKRLRSLGLGDFSEYCDFLFSGEGMEAEFHHLIDAVTTHKTDFFREAGHFDFLSGVALPELVKAGKSSLFAWSAACSTGEEPYTIAMVLAEFAASRTLSFSVLGTDISSGVLKTAREAVYKEEQIVPISAGLRKKYLLRSRDRAKRLVRMAPELRAAVRFSPLNLIGGDFGDIGLADIIFCRNVLIYFGREEQAKLLQRICGKLAPGGYLFMGHSEAVHGFGLPVAKVGLSVYRRTP